MYRPICFAKHPRLCNLLPAVMALLLQSSGAKRHIYSITNNLGWTESYQSTLRSVKGLKEKARQRIKDRIKEGPCRIVYDNCDLSLGAERHKTRPANFNYLCFADSNYWKPRGR